QWQIRYYCLFLMKRRNAYSPITSASAAQVTRFKRGTGEGPSLNNFCVDFKGTPRNTWNQAAAEVFAQSLVSSGWTRCQDVDMIKELFFIHLNTLKGTFQKQSHDGTEQQEDLEKEQQARRDRRRRGTRDRRSEACDLHEDLVRFKQAWKSLSWEVCSGDESESGKSDDDGYYAVTTLPWRSREVIQWCGPFDVVSLLNHYKSDGKAKRGNLPRQRRRGGTRVDRKSVPVKGLPLNFYDAAWLDTLHDDARKALDIQPSMELKHTDAVVK
ncbi:hypothetical protein LXA43DRAFT_902667, partial [Ganoderma leucocontextum]